MPFRFRRGCYATGGEPEREAEAQQVLRRGVPEEGGPAWVRVPVRPHVLLGAPPCGAARLQLRLQGLCRGGRSESIARPHLTPQQANRAHSVTSAWILGVRGREKSESMRAAIWRPDHTRDGEGASLPARGGMTRPPATQRKGRRGCGTWRGPRCRKETAR